MHQVLWNRPPEGAHIVGRVEGSWPNRSCPCERSSQRTRCICSSRVRTRWENGSRWPTSNPCSTDNVPAGSQMTARSSSPRPGSICENSSFNPPRSAFALNSLQSHWSCLNTRTGSEKFPNNPPINLVCPQPSRRNRQQTAHRSLFQYGFLVLFVPASMLFPLSAHRLSPPFSFLEFDGFPIPDKRLMTSG